MSNPRFQVVAITLSDGRKLCYTGREQVRATDLPATVVDVAFHEGCPLPDGCSFEDWPNEAEEAAASKPTSTKEVP